MSQEIFILMPVMLAVWGVISFFILRKKDRYPWPGRSERSRRILKRIVGF